MGDLQQALFDQSPVLIYNYDPMCSWCWAFSRTWQTVRAALGSKSVFYLAGGLAPDSAEPMPEAQRLQIQSYWRKIMERVPGTEFNFDFWSHNTPRRSTYLACRAVLAVKQLAPDKEAAMVDAIAKAYYLQAQNPSDADVLINCAVSLDVDAQSVQALLSSKELELVFQEHLALTTRLQQLGVASGFPSLVLLQEQQFKTIAIDYNHPESILEQLRSSGFVN